MLSGLRCVLPCSVLAACFCCQPVPCVVFPDPRGEGSFDTIQHCLSLVVLVLYWTSGYSLLSLLATNIMKLPSTRSSPRHPLLLTMSSGTAFFVPNKVAPGIDVNLFFLLIHFSWTETPAQCADILGLEESRHSAPQVVLLSVKTVPCKQAGVGTIRAPGLLPCWA